MQTTFIDYIFILASKNYLSIWVPNKSSNFKIIYYYYCLSNALNPYRQNSTHAHKIRTIQSLTILINFFKRVTNLSF